MNAEGAQAGRRRASACACSPRKLSKAYTSAKLSPVIGPEKADGAGGNSGGAGVPTAPDGDCDGDGIKNAVDLDDDNDLLPDTLELSLLLDPCSATPTATASRTASSTSPRSTSTTTTTRLRTLAPVPGQDAVPEPAVHGRRQRLRRRRPDLTTEYKLWKYTYEVNHTATRRCPAVVLRRRAVLAVGARGRQRPPRVPTMTAADYQPPQAFRAWADRSGLRPRSDHARRGSDASISTTWTRNGVDRHGPDVHDEPRRRRPAARAERPTGISTTTATSPTTSATRTPTA